MGENFKADAMISYIWPSWGKCTPTVYIHETIFFVLTKFSFYLQSSIIRSYFLYFRSDFRYMLHGMCCFVSRRQIYKAHIQLLRNPLASRSSEVQTSKNFSLPPSRLFCCYLQIFGKVSKFHTPSLPLIYSYS